MTDEPLQATLEAEYETELSRLGSSKAIYALTGGEMETEAVLDALATRTATAADAFDDWAGDDAYGALFEEAAATARDHADRVAGPASGSPVADESDQVVAVLEVQEGSDARLGALLAWTLVTDRTLAQAVGFFVGNADPGSADRFRELRAEVDALRETAAEQAEAADSDVALAAANGVVEAAYDRYVATLEGLGVKVKPVC